MTNCTVNPNEKHTLWVKMNGPDSYRGNYSECVDYKGYEFKFYVSNYSNNYTNTTAGQIHGLLCSFKYFDHLLSKKTSRIYSTNITHLLLASNSLSQSDNVYYC